MIHRIESKHQFFARLFEVGAEKVEFLIVLRFSHKSIHEVFFFFNALLEGMGTISRARSNIFFLELEGELSRSMVFRQCEINRVR